MLPVLPFFKCKFCTIFFAIAVFIFMTNRLFNIVSDDVIVTGVLSAKWSSDLKDVRCDLDPILIANNVRY